MQIEKISLSKLTPYQNNAKEHPASQIEQIKESIRKYGNNDPIAVWGENNIIVEGHGRYIALKELGETEAEIIRLDRLTDEERKEYTLVHNKLTMNTDYDFEMLQSELDSLLDFDAEFYGFEDMMNDLDDAETYEPKMENKGSLREKYIVPPFSVIYGNKPDWFRRKRAWVSFGIRSEIGRGAAML